MSPESEQPLYNIQRVQTRTSRRGGPDPARPADAAGMGLRQLHLRSGRGHRLAHSQRRADRSGCTGGVRTGVADRFLLAAPPPANDRL